MPHPYVIVAIPVRNEEALIGACLEALDHQTWPCDRLVLLLNNCTDRTFEICSQYRARRPGVEIHEQTLHGTLACAGEARRLAFHYAAQSGPDSVILTTDADAVPERSWIEKNLREIAAGAEAVCGMAYIKPQDAEVISRVLRDDDALETYLLRFLDEIASLLNPDRFDPWPRHQQESGASIAVKCDVLQLAGGAPHVSSCEDRAMIERLRLIDARIRHAPDIRVEVSGRQEGRAAGGMAETIKRRMVQQDALTDEKLEPAIDAYRRALAQSRLRAARQGKEDGSALAKDLLISPFQMSRILRLKFFGQAWAETQAASPVLQRRRVAFAALKREIRAALSLREKLLSTKAAALNPSCAAARQNA